MINLEKYLSLTKMMILATNDSTGNPYTANVYFKADKENNFYFRSKYYREHSQHIINNWKTARSIINTEKFKKEDNTKKWLQFQWSAIMLKWEEFETTSKNIYWIDQKYDDLTDSCSRIFKCSPNKVKIRDEAKYWWNWFIYSFDTLH